MFILQNVGRQNNDSDCGAFVLQVGSTPLMYLFLQIERILGPKSFFGNNFNLKMTNALQMKIIMLKGIVEWCLVDSSVWRTDSQQQIQELNQVARLYVCRWCCSNIPVNYVIQPS